MNMKLLLATIAVTFLASGIQGNPWRTERAKSVAREAANITDSPYTAQIRLVDGDLACSGAIMNFLYILTTASCVHGYAREDLTVFLGASNSFDGTSYSLSKIIIHDEYDPSDENRFNDIAMLKISGIIKYNQSVRPVRVPETFDTENIVEGSTAVVSGWGEYESLRIVDQIVKTVAECNESYSPLGKTITDAHVCGTNELNSGTDVEENDVGSPLVQNSVLIGLKSWSVSGYPDVYTRVFAHRIWIDENNME